MESIHIYLYHSNQNCHKYQGEIYDLRSNAYKFCPFFFNFRAKFVLIATRIPHFIRKIMCSKSHTSRNSHFQNSIFSKIHNFLNHILNKNHIFKVAFFTKITFQKLRSLFLKKNHIFKVSFFTKITFSKSHFSKNHIFKVSFFTKITFSKSCFSQKSHFRSQFFTQIAFLTNFLAKFV